MLIFRGLHSSDSQPVALTIGNFDGVHLGHQALLTQLRSAASARGMQSAVVVFEPYPREFFSPGEAPARLTSLREKLELFSAHGLDRVYVCRFNHQFAGIEATDFAWALRKQAGARLVVVGDDFRFGSGRSGDMALMQRAGAQCGFEVLSISSIMHDGVRISSTAVRAALAEGRLDRARDFLGRNYSISGRVVHGDGIGRTLGFPTANIALRRNRPPLQGIFAVKLHGVEVQQAAQGAASLGVRPTVRAGAVPVLEVHLLAFNRQIYGQRVRVEFLHKLRDEQKFPDLESLTRQIGLDVEQTKTWFEQHHG